MKPSARATKRRQEQREAMRVIVDAVRIRAKGHCEACGWKLGPIGEYDHWLGGSGRRRQLQSVENVWQLCLQCHADRTKNFPSATHWNQIFEHHCSKFGYAFVRHKENPFGDFIPPGWKP